MKKYIVLLLIFIFSFFLFGCTKKEKKLTDLDVIKQRGYIVVGVKNDSPPFGFYDKKHNLVGMDIEIANAIAEHIFNEKSYGYVKFVNVTPQNRIAKLNSKEVDVLVATMSINNKRKLIIDFSLPYFVANQKIMIRKTSKIKNLHYFNKEGRLAVILGTTGEKVARFVVPNANLVGAKTYLEAYNLLINNQIDAILGDDCILNSFSYDNKRVQILSHAYSREFYAVALRKTEDSKDLLNCVNTAVSDVLDRKKLNFISKKWYVY